MRMWWPRLPPSSATQTPEVLGSGGTDAHVLATIPVDTAAQWLGMPGAAQLSSTVGTAYAFHIL